jgi:hypothetical protein
LLYGKSIPILTFKLVMDPQEEYDLVVKALTSGLSNCVEWINDETARRVRRDRANQGLTPEGIKKLLLDFVAAGGRPEQRREERAEYKEHRAFWYKAIVPVDGFRDGLFVEMELSDDDPDVPIVWLLNAHPQQ